MAPSTRSKKGSKKGKHSVKAAAPTKAPVQDRSGSEAEDGEERVEVRLKHRAGGLTGDSVEAIKARMAADQLSLERMEAADELTQKIAELDARRDGVLSGSIVPSTIKDSSLG